MTATRSMEPRPWKPIEAFQAQEGADPLANAFAGRRAVHPFVGLSPVPQSEWSRTWTEMTSAARSGKSVAYLHVPFCESHCLFCGFYQNTWHESAGAVYAKALVEHLKRDRDRPYQAEGPIQAIYVGGGTPTLLSTRRTAGSVTRDLGRGRAYRHRSGAGRPGPLCAQAHAADTAGGRGAGRRLPGRSFLPPPGRRGRVCRPHWRISAVWRPRVPGWILGRGRP